MPRRVPAIFRVLLLLGMAAAASSAVPFRAVAANTAAVLTLDPGHTTIHFTLPTLTHTVHGTFALKSGTVRINPQTGEASGEIIVDAASGKSGNGMRDSRMKNSILEVAKYPAIRFVPHKVRIDGAPQGQFHASLSGIFFLHGSGHELTLDMLIDRSKDSFTAKTHFVVPYVKWGLKDPSFLFLTVSKQVKIDVTGTGKVRWISSPAR